MKDLIFLFAFFLSIRANHWPSNIFPTPSTEFKYQFVGTGHCADSLFNPRKLPFFRIGGSIGEDACVARCDGDNACLGYSYHETDCFNFYGTSRLTVTWDLGWEEGPTTQFESTSFDGLKTGYGDSSAICMKKLNFFNNGQIFCADGNMHALNFARATTFAEERTCRTLCDLDDACLAYRYIYGNSTEGIAFLCYNFFGAVHLSAFSGWTMVDTSYSSPNPVTVHPEGHGTCMAKNPYEVVGGGTCADANGDLLPVARKGNGIGNKACRERCDVDPACIGFRYIENLCYNVFADQALAFFNDWDAIDEPSTASRGIAEAKGNVGICMRKKTFPTPAPTNFPTTVPTMSPTSLPTKMPTLAPTEELQITEPESEQSEFARWHFNLLSLVSLIVGVCIGVGCTCMYSKSESTKSAAETVDLEEPDTKRKPATQSEITTK